MAKRLGKDTIEFSQKPRVCLWASIVGKKEGEGPLSAGFDRIVKDDLLGEKTWELAESRMFQQSVEACLAKGNLKPDDVNILIGGDLINQIMATHFAARELDIPLLGLYGACSTIAEAFTVGAAFVDGGGTIRVVCASSSHFCSAERQYRSPLEMGGQRNLSAQWTVTGAGAFLICDTLHAAKPTAHITHSTIGRVTDYGINDATNMGAVMAPAAARTLAQHLTDTNRTVSDYDMILTGDLGAIGHELFIELLRERGIYMPDNLTKDCGMMIYSGDQHVHSGGSGAGCASAVLASTIFPMFERREVNRVAFIATGALLSASSTFQGETIPAVAHLVVFERV
ncbi:stage V sporulation protein AD [Clostridia bacterium]|nr:stage V sporulation protein AD [Clostridia bacterium]